MAKSVEVPTAGRSSEASYCAFGDDSAFGDILVYAFVVVARERRAALEEAILKVKADGGIPEDVPIHLNRLLNKHTKAKDRVEHVDAHLLVARLFDVLNAIGTAIFFNFMRIPASGKLYPDDLEIGGQKIHEEHKAILHQLACSCFVPFVKIDENLLCAKDFEVFVSQDRTRVKVIGQQRRRAQNMARMLIPTTNPITPGSYVRLNPYFVLNRHVILCQVADCVAYCLSHSLSSKPRVSRYSSLIEKLRFMYRAPAG